MSEVTNLILTFSILESLDERLKEVNAYFVNTKGLVSIDDYSLPMHWYGGTKMVEAEVCLGAFNYLDLESFLEHCKKNVQ